MKRYVLTFSPEAEQDLDDIYTNIALAGFPMNAARFVQKVTKFCHELTSFPQRGQMRDDLEPGARLLGFRRQVAIIFTVRESESIVEVLRCLWLGRNDQKAFGGSNE